MGRSEVSTIGVKWSEAQRSAVKLLGTGCPSLLEDIQIIQSLLLFSYSFGSILYHCTYIWMYVLYAFV